MRMVHHEKQTTWHGSVTVFFSLAGVLILCLLLAVVEAVRIQGAKAQTANRYTRNSAYPSGTQV